ncbi:MAG: sigma-54 dependent transcriptional regulator [Bacteroidales bacterium]|jgi:transcriptional regulator with PAS, ATPase and Fis domain|nr:sigma-54 dependent transcriptional regulator [Bacteroidales bacterium]
MDLQTIKQRFGVIGNSILLERALDIAMQVATTDLTVLITGESGVGKEVFPKIIHTLSSKKHGNYIAVNCGAIPEGTIDSELFGHEKGSFTGAHDARKGYFEVADGGTIFLDEIAELPLGTQVRLLRVLESGEFMKVGSSKGQKTDVRVIAASNVNIPEAISKSKFRQDLYYRLNTVPIQIPSLRERKEDIHLLFRKFASDFAEKYRMPAIRLDEEAQKILLRYRWDGNIRQLKNITEQISIIEKEKDIDARTISKYLPDVYNRDLPVIYNKGENENISERDLLYKVFFDMKRDMTDLKKVVLEMLQREDVGSKRKENDIELMRKLDTGYEIIRDKEKLRRSHMDDDDDDFDVESFDDQVFDSENTNEEVMEESLSIHKKEEDLIRRALEKHKSKRKDAAKDLGISERTLYRKIKEYNII